MCELDNTMHGDGKSTRELPDWWTGKDGSAVLMPKFRVNGYWLPSGTQVEEMIFNFMQNENYVGYQVQKYFGSTKPIDIMQKWNNDIKLYTGSNSESKPLFVCPGNDPSWKRFHNYVQNNGVPLFHADLAEKVPVRPSKQNKFSAAPNRGMHHMYCIQVVQCR